MGSKWMVDVKGSDGEAGGEDIKQAIEDLDFAALIEKQGSVASAIQSFIIDNNYSISDRGGGGGSWHLGVPFNDLAEAVTYLDLITTKFSAAIGSRLIRVELKTWSAGLWRGTQNAKDS